MAFIDELTLYAEAGKGGNGVVRWRREKYIDKGGPNGGNGGRGGDIYAEAIKDIHALADYKHKKEYYAENGTDGGGTSSHGKSGEHLFFKFPVGSIIRNKNTGEEYRLETPGEQILLLKGGQGGLGNEHFKSSINQSPEQQTDGKPGEGATFSIELELFADAGFVGLPNAGKSSLLNSLTNATAKVGNYQFTTLDPNLGALYEFVLADIPGLIEGASGGKGLGFKFLRHIKRTKILVHLVSFENEDMIAVYESIRKELASYDEELASKDEIILLTKTDTTTPERVEEMKKKFEKYGKPVYTLTLFDNDQIKQFQDELVKILRG